MLNLNQLYTFYILVKSGSFTRASEKLFITEPAVFMQIKSLEQQIQYKLVDRIGRELKLTELGQIVFSYCEKIFDQVQELTTIIDNFKDMRLGVLKIGVAKVIMNYLMPLLLAPFMEKYPQIRIQLEENSTRDLIEGLTNGLYEVVISALLSYPKRLLAFTPFTTACLYLVGSARNSGDVGDCIDISTLEKIPLIMKDKRSATRYIAEKALQKAGVKPLIILESGSMEFIKNFVREGKGFSFLPDLAIKEEVKSGTLRVIRINGMDLTYDVGVYYLKGKTLSPQAKTFLNYLSSLKEEKICDLVERLQAENPVLTNLS